MPRSRAHARDRAEPRRVGDRARRVAGLVHPQHERPLGVPARRRGRDRDARRVDGDRHRSAAAEYRAHLVASGTRRRDTRRCRGRGRAAAAVRQRRDELLGADARADLPGSTSTPNRRRSTRRRRRAGPRSRRTPDSPSTRRAPRPRLASRPREPDRTACRSSSRRCRPARCRRAASARRGARTGTAAARSRRLHRDSSLGGRRAAHALNSANRPADASGSRACTRVPASACTSTSTSPARCNAASTSPRSYGHDVLDDACERAQPLADRFEQLSIAVTASSPTPRPNRGARDESLHVVADRRGRSSSTRAARARARRRSRAARCPRRRCAASGSGADASTRCTSRSASETSSSVVRNASTSCAAACARTRPCRTSARSRRPAGAGGGSSVERREQLILDEHAGVREAVEQRRLAGVRVADERDAQQLPPAPGLALRGARRRDLRRSRSSFCTRRTSRRRSTSSWVSPGPRRVPMPPACWLSCRPRPRRRGKRYRSCASSTWIMPSWLVAC